MEQMRILLAIVLSFLVFFVWNMFFVDHEQVPPPKQAQLAQEKSGETPYVPEKATPAAPPAAKAVSPAAPREAVDTTRATVDARNISVETPLYRVKFSEAGAAIQSFVLKHFRKTVDDDKTLLDLIPEALPRGTVTVGMAGNALPGLQDAIFKADTPTTTVVVEDQPRILSFKWQTPDGFIVEKHYRMDPAEYRIDLQVVVKNGSGRNVKDSLVVSLFQKSNNESRAYGFEGPSAFINKRLEQIDIDDIKDKDTYTGSISWIAIQDRYFLTSLFNDSPLDATMKLSWSENGILGSHFIFPPAEMGAGTEHRFDQKLYFGPKSLKILNQYGGNLAKVVDFGWFDIIAKPCVWVLNFLYDLIPNYGIAIIILTLITKVLLWPLGQKSYKSMGQMKKLQPLMAEIREKYKNDRKKMNEEVMGLYKTYKINPMGGCLPMVVQIPIFIALYRMLYETIELRHAPFFGWINDLSAPDRLFNFAFSIPFMQAPYGIPVLTVVMGATMFLQQKMSPPMGDPAQAKMMMLMPIVFTFIFINFPSGLVLYWLVNNVFSIAQQYYTTKKQA